MFSRTAKYAVMALVELAGRGNGGPVRVKTLAAAAGVPQSFLAKLVHRLVRAGILSSARGKGGGIAFAHPPEEITLAQVIRAVEGERPFDDCPFLPDPCPGLQDCPLFELWDPVREELVAFLENTTLAQVAALKGGGNE